MHGGLAGHGGCRSDVRPKRRIHVQSEVRHVPRTDGLAAGPMGKAMKIPSVKSPDFMKLSESDMVADTSNGKNKMPAYKGKLTDAQIKEVVGYMRTLEK